MSEDCLTLNIWTPEPRASAKRPVMVWFHGGGFEGGGSGSANWYEGARLSAGGNVVVVNVTHRLNVFGFLYLSELGGESIDAESNVGMLDAVAALRWVQNNIAQFGGDPNRVTVFGASGGAGKVAVLMSMPEAEGLFHRAIMQSGAPLRLETKEEATHSARALLDQLQRMGQDIARLETIDASTLIAARRAIADAEGASFRPVVDGKTMTAHPFDGAPPAYGARIPLMIGFTGTETTLLLADEENFSLDETTLRTKLAEYIREDKVETAIEALDQSDPGLTPSEKFFRLTTDNWYLVPTTVAATLKSAEGTSPVHMYMTEWRTPVDGGRWRSPHLVDLPFIFDNVALAPSMVGEGPAQQLMAAKMSASWAAFAHTGNPNIPNIPEWPSYDPTLRRVMVFDNENRVVFDPLDVVRQVLSA